MFYLFIYCITWEEGNIYNGGKRGGVKEITDIMEIKMS